MSHEYLKTLITLVITWALVFFADFLSKTPVEYENEFNDVLKTKNQEDILEAL